MISIEREWYETGDFDGDGVIFWGDVFEWACGLQGDEGSGRRGAFSDCCGGDELVGTDGDSFVTYDYDAWNV